MALFLSFLLPLLSFAADCDDAGKVYRYCQDQKKIYEDSKAKAEGENQLMLVAFGADWCPWCRSLHTLLVVERESHQIAGKAVIEEIALYKDQDKIPSGWAVLDEVAGYSKAKVDKEGIPLLAVVNPKNKKAVFIDTAKIEKNTKVSKGHDMKKLAAAVKKAMASVK